MEFCAHCGIYQGDGYMCASCVDNAAAILPLQIETQLRLGELQRQVFGNLPEEMRVLRVVFKETAEAINQFVDAYQAGFDQDFDEIVERYGA